MRSPVRVCVCPSVPACVCMYVFVKLIYCYFRSKNQEVRTMKSEVGSRKSEVGSRNSELGSRNSELGSRNSDFESRKLEVRKMNSLSLT